MSRKFPASQTLERQRTLRELVDEYLGRDGCMCDDEDRYYSMLPSYNYAIRSATFALTVGGKRSRHQRRIYPHTLEDAYAKLHEIRSQLKTCQTYHLLWERVCEVASPIWGLGELYVYDTSRRIGAFLGLYPKRVYLHAGTRIGAKALHLDYRRPYLEKGDLPPELRRLPAKKIEDFLCIYKAELPHTR